MFRGLINPSAALADDLTPLQAREDGGLFCRETIQLDAGPHTLRMQIQLPLSAPGQTLRLSANDSTGRLLAETRLDSNAPNRAERADALTMSFTLDEPAQVTIEGVASSHAALTHLRHATCAPVPAYAGHEALFRFAPEPDFEVRPPTSVIFGTTAVCNANCFHCPTNKAYSRTQAKGFMDQALFERIVEQLAEMGFEGGITLGMFGEPLQDPLILQRMQTLRRLLPRSVIVPSTNAAVYDPDKHREALALADDVAIHIEATSDAVYNQSMRPLKTHRTFPRAEQLIRDRQGRRSHIVTPVHTRNLAEAADLRDQWETRFNLPATVFTPLRNRAGQSAAYDDVALAPQAIGCGPDVLDHLMVEWDGSVLMCCQDFHRKQIIGDLKVQTLREVLAGEPRRRLITALNDKRWNGIDICAGCKGDDDASVQGRVAERLKTSDAARTFLPPEFSCNGQAVVAGSTLRVSTIGPWLSRLLRRSRNLQAVIFGPYKPLYPGRYEVRFDMSNMRSTRRAWLFAEVVAPDAVLAGRKTRMSWRRGSDSISLSVDVPDYVPLQFRLTARGADFDFLGVTVTRKAD